MSDGQFPALTSEQSPGGSVYKIFNTVNTLLYIGGTTTDLEVRWKSHKYAGKSKKATRHPLYLAMREYGVEQFGIEELEICPNGKVLWTREMDYIRLFNTKHPDGYNLKAIALTDEQAAIIKFNYYQVTVQEYADMFGITKSLASLTRCRPPWVGPYSHVTRDSLPKAKGDITQCN